MDHVLFDGTGFNCDVQLSNHWADFYDWHHAGLIYSTPSVLTTDCALIQSYLGFTFTFKFTITFTFKFRITFTFTKTNHARKI